VRTSPACCTVYISLAGRATNRRGDERAKPTLLGQRGERKQPLTGSLRQGNDQMDQSQCIRTVWDDQSDNPGTAVVRRFEKPVSWITARRAGPPRPLPVCRRQSLLRSACSPRSGRLRSMSNRRWEARTRIEQNKDIRQGVKSGPIPTVPTRSLRSSAKPQSPQPFPRFTGRSTPRLPDQHKRACSPGTSPELLDPLIFPLRDLAHYAN
jgi:hypothetical protein